MTSYTANAAYLASSPFGLRAESLGRYALTVSGEPALSALTREDAIHVYIRSRDQWLIERAKHVAT